MFLINEDQHGNLNQMVEAVSRDGYVVAQEYLEAAAEGDMRLFMMNGQPLRYKGKYAAFRRLRSSEDIRSNIHAGGKKAKAVVDDVALHIAEIVRPKLVEDGMFLVGLDIVGSKLMEINVFSPGGLGEVPNSFEGGQLCSCGDRSPGKKSRVHGLLPTQLQQHRYGNALGIDQKRPGDPRAQEKKRGSNESNTLRLDGSVRGK